MRRNLTKLGGRTILERGEKNVCRRSRKKNMTLTLCRAGALNAKGHCTAVNSIQFRSRKKNMMRYVGKREG